MHILLIHQAFAALDEPGGTRHHELARYLVEQGQRVTVITSPVSYLTGKPSPTPAFGSPKRWVLSPLSRYAGEGGGWGVGEGRITILRPYAYPAWHRSFVHRMFSFFSFMVSSFWSGLKVRQVDLVWGTSPPIFQGVTAWMLARLKRAHFLFEVRDLWPAFAVGVGVLRNPLLIRASQWLEGFLYRRAERVVVNSPGFIEHVRQRGARRVELVPNSADPRMFDPQADGAGFRRAYGLEGKFVALYAGAHGMSNDLGVMLEAASLLGDHPEIAIVLLGDGKEKPALVRRAAEMGLTSVHFLPPVPKNEMSEALAAANACIAILKPIPLYETVYPNKVFDYMAAGRPVILAIGGVIRKVIEDARAGIAVQPGDALAMAEAIRQMADDPNRGREMGLRGRRYLEEHFDRSVIAGKLLSVMQDMTGSK